MIACNDIIDLINFFKSLTQYISLVLFSFLLPTTSSKNLSKIKGQKQDEESNSYLRIELLSIISTYVLILALLIKWVDAHKYLGTVAVKCKKKIAFWNVNFFFLKIA